MTEDAFLRTVLDMARLFGWRAIHVRPAWTKKGWRSPIQGPGSKGFPDILMLKGATQLVCELKVGKGKTTQEQEDWLADFDKIEVVKTALWTPTDWAAIEEELSQ